jgi:hypothetical protein
MFSCATDNTVSTTFMGTTFNQGLCDFACGFCNVTCPVPRPVSNPNSTCTLVDVGDAGRPGMCSQMLHQGTYTCPTAGNSDHPLSLIRPHAGQCNLACHMNPLEHLLAFPAIAGIDGSDPVGAVDIIRRSLLAIVNSGVVTQGWLWTLGLAIPNAYDLVHGWGTCAGIVAGGQYPCSQYFQAGQTYAGLCDCACGIINSTNCINTQQDYVNIFKPARINPRDNSVVPGLCQRIIGAEPTACSTFLAPGVLQPVIDALNGGITFSHGLCEFACGDCQSTDPGAYVAPTASTYGRLCDTPGQCCSSSHYTADASCCGSWIAAGMKCADVFAPGRLLAGFCDRVCGYCLPLDPCSGLICGTNGQCLQGQCVCDPGYLGAACQFTVAQCSAASAYTVGSTYTAACCTMLTDTIIEHTIRNILLDRGWNLLDHMQGNNTCAIALAQGLTCSEHFAPGRSQAGECDFECGYCERGVPQNGHLYHWSIVPASCSRVCGRAAYIARGAVVCHAEVSTQIANSYCAQTGVAAPAVPTCACPAISASPCLGPRGCTNSTATNFDADAVLDDGSCLYVASISCNTATEFSRASDIVNSACCRDVAHPCTNGMISTCIGSCGVALQLYNTLCHNYLVSGGLDTNVQHALAMCGGGH